MTWVPATDDPSAFAALLAGLTPMHVASADERELMLRVHGEVRASRLRTTLLKRALPVPVQTPAPKELEQFRRRHGDQLPALRRHLEALIDETLAIGDEVLQFRALERVAEETEELLTQVESYLREAGFRRVRRSALLRILKFVPGASGVIGAAQETAGALENAAHVESEPLAYLAFARAELRLDNIYRTQVGNAALAEIFAT